MAFTEFPIATAPIAEAADGIVMGGLLIDGVNLQHVRCGVFYRPGIDYSHCFWEIWVKPSSEQGAAGYMLADTQGGAHCLLWGYQPIGGGFVEVTGNIYDGTTLTSYTHDEPIPADHDAHLAHGWDGAHILGWHDGVLVYKKAYSPTQRRNPGGNDATLYIGGSDHSGMTGKVYQVRGYEGYGRCYHDTDFAPELYFQAETTRATDVSPDIAQFCMSLMSKQGQYVDTGKFEGVHHHGIPEAVQGTQIISGSAIGYTLSMPSFEPGVMERGTFVPTAPATPAGAVIWDSFSRANRTSVSPDPTSLFSFYTLGAVEIGGVNWTNLDGTTDSGGAGILNGRAFIANAAPGKLVQTGIQDMDVRVNRLPTDYHHTALYVRYKDDNDYYQILAEDNAIVVNKKEGGVATAVGYTPTTGWTTLRVVANGTTLTVYTGTGTEGTFTSQGSFTCTNVSGATKAGIERVAGVKTVFYYDNFLVKAA